MLSMIWRSGVLLGICFSASMLMAAESVKFPAEKIKEVEIYKLTGDIEISTVTGGEAWIEKAGTACKTEIALEQNTLTVREMDTNSGANCPEPLKAFIPANVALRLNSNAANVAAQGLQGSVDLEIGSGNTVFTNSGGSIRAYVNSGNVKLDQFYGRAHMRTKSGNIVISMKDAATDGQLNLETTSGNVSVKLPQGLDAVTNLKSTSGNIVDDFGPSKDKTHPLRVRVQTKSGDVAVQRTLM